MELQQVTDKIRQLWRNREGPFENIFRLLSYMVPFVPGLGWGVFALEKVASMFGWGMGDLGGALDKAMNLDPGTHLGMPDNEDIERGVTTMFEQQQKAASSNEELQKVASIGGLFRLIGGAGKISRILFSVLKWLLLAFGITKLGDMYAGATGQTGTPEKGILDEITEDEEKEKPKGPAYTSEDVSGLMDIMNPEGLANMFNPIKLLNPLG